MDQGRSSLTSPGFLVVAGLVPLAFLAVFYFYPLAGIFVKSFFHDRAFHFGFIHDFFGSARIASIIWFTIWQAALSTVLTLVLALPCAHVMARYDFFGKRMLMTVATIPFVLPTVVVAAAFRAVGGANGFVPLQLFEHPLFLILLAHVFYNFSVVLRIVSAHMSYIRNEISEAAHMLGASGLKTFFRVTLPMLKPSILASCLLVFIFCFSSFGVILILGGPGYSTIEVEIYRQAVHIFNLPAASLLSIVQILMTLAVMYGYTVFQKKTIRYAPESESLALRRPRTAGERWMAAGTVLVVLVLCFLPLAALAARSFVYKGEVSLVFYRALFENVSGSLFYIPPIKAALNSFFFSVATLFMAVAVGLCAAIFINGTRGRTAALIDPVFMLPLSTSAATLGFGIIITLDTPPLDLRSSPFIVPVAHTLVAFPFVVRAVLPALRTIPDNLKASAALMGASAFRVFRYVELPVIARALTAGALFAFCISVGEFGATVFTARPEYATLPMAIYRFFGQPGALNYGQAMAVSTILMAVTAAGFIVIENVRSVRGEGF